MTMKKQNKAAEQQVIVLASSILPQAESQKMVRNKAQATEKKSVFHEFYY